MALCTLGNGASIELRSRLWNTSVESTSPMQDEGQDQFFPVQELMLTSQG